MLRSWGEAPSISASAISGCRRWVVGMRGHLRHAGQRADNKIRALRADTSSAAAR